MTESTVHKNEGEISAGNSFCGITIKTTGDFSHSLAGKGTIWAQGPGKFSFFAHAQDDTALRCDRLRYTGFESKKTNMP